MYASKDLIWREIWKILQKFLGTKQGLPTPLYSFFFNRWWPSSGCNHSLVIRTGPAVRPLKDQTRACTGSVHLKDRSCNWTGKNRLNRPFFWRTVEPVGSIWTAPVWARCCLYYAHAPSCTPAVGPLWLCWRPAAGGLVPKLDLSRAC